MSKAMTPHEQVLATMGTWVASIADNVNNPIAGISTAVAIIEREMAACRDGGSFHQELVDDSLRRIRVRLQKLGDYVAELTEVARPATVKPSRVAIADVFHTASLVRHHDHDVSIEYRVEPRAESVLADPMRLKATLRALVLNSLEAAGGHDMPKPRLRLSATCDQRTARRGVTILVEDNGPGFKAADLARVTEPFFSTKEASSGLGLAAAQRFASAHGGHLQVGASSSLGGAAVSLFLPDAPVNT